MKETDSPKSGCSVRIYNSATSSSVECAPGITVKEFLDSVQETGCTRRVLAAYVNNELKGLGHRLYTDAYVRFVDINSPDGRRTYMRSLSMVVQKVLSENYPDYTLHCDYSLPDGLYAELRPRNGDSAGCCESVRPDPIGLLMLKKKIQELIARDIPFSRKKIPNEQAVELFSGRGQQMKASLIRSREDYFVNVSELDGYIDTFYGPLLYSTGEIDKYDVVPYGEGFCLQYPSVRTRHSLHIFQNRSKLAEVFEESTNWNIIQGISCMASVNDAILRGKTREMIALAESLHERKYARIADMIASRKDVKMVLISGPSSSGKTTTSMRIALQCRVLGLNPIVVGMDDYFVDRELTPKDENGKYDFESPYAVNLELLNTQMNALFEGREVELPKYDFVEGKGKSSGRKVKMGPSDILIMEGIHALNPIITEKMDEKYIFKVFASALTSLNMDENNQISTTDSRLLRRMLRDYRTRGHSPESTILMWPSVRAGEEKNIFPYQENADVMFNSTLVYELPVLKYYVEPLLRRIGPVSPAYSEALRLLNFLSYIEAITPEECFCVPATSVLREFIGGSSFEY